MSLPTTEAAVRRPRSVLPTLPNYRHLGKELINHVVINKLHLRLLWPTVLFPNRVDMFPAKRRPDLLK